MDSNKYVKHNTLKKKKENLVYLHLLLDRLLCSFVCVDSKLFCIMLSFERAYLIEINNLFLFEFNIHLMCGFYLG